MVVDMYNQEKNEQKISINLSDAYMKRKMDSKEREMVYEFPVKKFIVNFSFKKNDPALWNQSESTYASSGVCYEFTKLNREITSASKKSGIFTDDEGHISIVARVDINIVFSDHFVMNDAIMNKVNIELDSTISHEINHLFDSYNRISRHVNRDHELDLSADIDAFIGVVKIKNPSPELISKDLFALWEDFTYLIYYSEPHEINAVSQESLSYIKNGVPLDKIPGWHVQEKLNNFNKDEFIKEMLELAGGDESKLELLKSDFAERFRKLLVSQGRLIGGKYNTKHDMDFIMKSTFRRFVNRFSRLISKHGNRLKRNILRLYAYEN
jgi:hypothetical protein